MNKRVAGTTLIIILTILITSCGPSENSVQTAIAQTQAANPTETLIPSPTITQLPSNTPPSVPTSTPTQIPISSLDLESIIVQTGDLPAGYTPAQVRFVLPAMFDGIPNPDYSIYLQFEHDNDPAGGVGIMVYADSTETDHAFAYIAESLGPDTVSIADLGDRALYAAIRAEVFGYLFESIDLAFSHCTTVIHIRMSDTSDPDYILAYARRLDERIYPLVSQCGEIDP